MRFKVFILFFVIIFGSPKLISAQTAKSNYDKKVWEFGKDKLIFKEEPKGLEDTLFKYIFNSKEVKLIKCIEFQHVNLESFKSCENDSRYESIISMIKKFGPRAYYNCLDVYSKRHDIYDAVDVRCNETTEVEVFKIFEKEDIDDCLKVQKTYFNRKIVLPQSISQLFVTPEMYKSHREYSTAIGKYHKAENDYLNSIKGKEYDKWCLSEDMKDYLAPQMRENPSASISNQSRKENKTELNDGNCCKYTDNECVTDCSGDNIEQASGNQQ